MVGIADIQLINCIFDSADVVNKYSDLRRPWINGRYVYDDSIFSKWIRQLTRTSDIIDTQSNYDSFHYTKQIDDVLSNNHFIINVSHINYENHAFNDTNYRHLPIKEFHITDKLGSEHRLDLKINEINTHVAVDLLHSKLSERKVVRLHCMAGRNRSASVAILYFMKYLHMSLEDAYLHVATRREIVLSSSQAEILWRFEKSRNADNLISICKISVDTLTFGITWTIRNLAMYELYVLKNLQNSVN